MICISINQESRRLALVDMHNAAKQCDLLEIRLDRFGMAPELRELLEHKPAPVIMSCRRQKEGGHWDGSEAERLALLRQCIVSKADYVEIEVDVADQIKRMPPTKRVISYHVKPSDSADAIAEKYAQAQKKDADVIKLTAQVRTPEEAWPLVRILSKPPVPTVVVGLGAPGIMLSILAKKMNAPWTYAALEKGMEAYPGQRTVHELQHVYHYEKIQPKTRLIGVTGVEDWSYCAVAGLNAALEHLQLSARCLPMSVGSAKLFRRVVDAVKLASVVVDHEHQQMLVELADQHHPSAKFAGAADLIIEKAEKRQSYYTAVQAAVAALAAQFKAGERGDDPLKNRVVVIVGLNANARSLAADLQHHGASVILASHSRKAAQETAKEVNCRFIQFDAIYTTLHDVLIVCDHEKEERAKKKAAGLHPSSLKEHLTVMDLTNGLLVTELLREAKQRGCRIVHPREILLQQLVLQTKLLTGKNVDRKVFVAAMPDWLLEE